jgi:hypothetical protein
MAAIEFKDSTLYDANTKAYYRFVDGSELLDETANDNDLTAIGVPVQGTPKWGTGCVGLGTSQAFSAEDGADFQPAGNFSVSAWVRTTKTAGDMMIFQTYSRNTNYAGIYFYISTTTGYARMLTGKNTGTTSGVDYQQIIGGTAVTDGAWHHVVVTYDGSNLNLYLDGASDASAVAWTSAAAFAATNYVRVGCINNTGTNGSYFQGCLDEVAFFPSNALSLEQVQALYAKSIAHADNSAIKALASAIYLFEDGAQLTDSSTGGTHTLTAIGTPTTCTTKFGGSVFLGNSSAYSAVDADVLKPTGAFTIRGWIKTAYTAAKQSIFQSYSANTDVAGIELRINITTGYLSMISGRDSGTVDGTDYKTITNSVNLADNTYHFVVGTSDGTNLKLYVDGKSAATPVAWANHPAYDATNYVRVGCDNVAGTNASFFRGQIDDLTLTNGVALDLANVIRLYMGTGIKSLNNSYSPSMGKIAGVAFASVNKLSGVTNVVTS